MRQLYLLLLLFVNCIYSQNGNLNGKIFSEGQPLPNVSVSIVGQPSFQTITGSNGVFDLKNIPFGNYQLQLSSIGYQTLRKEIQINSEKHTIELEMHQDYLSLEEVVITATRSEVPRYKSPVIVSRISSKSFETTQSLSISEGLNFTPGLRLETNCQNCGFTQVRMNGLEGPYSQILINSRPIFSALVGVYGLEMLPTSMIDRVEVIRGGGSALYGGSAIAGTVNIITKDPIENSFEIGTNYSFTDFSTPDKTINVNGSIVSEDYQKGISIYAYNRDRKPWDANEDGFSEMTKLKNTTFGFDAFWNTSDLSKLKLNLFNISEFRRGGNKMDMAPHQTDITEQLDHKILGGGLSFEKFSQDYKHKYAIYTSAQSANRDSYYGGGGRVLAPGDTLEEQDIIALNSYGNSKDLSIVGGGQYSYEFNEKFLLLSGGEYQMNEVNDQMPGYKRKIDQKVGTLGMYSQLEIKPIEKLSFLVGARFDHISIDGKHHLEAVSYADKKNFNVFVPRFTTMYTINDALKARASYSEGYRAPQAFDEDLHIEIVGGAASFTQLADDLKMEKSRSINASLNYSKSNGAFQSNVVLEGFYTQLKDAFITSNPQELESGISVTTKRNGSGAYVMGLNLETNFALSSKINLQLGGTYQSANYKAEEIIWQSEDESEKTTTKKMLRTPDLYGYYTLSYYPIKPLNLSFSGVYTGSMEVAHRIDPITERTIVKSVKDFFENNIKVAYDFDFSNNCLQVYSGVQNIFNAYQNDFDTGIHRDASYVYGPSRPRTFFVGLKYSIN